MHLADRLTGPLSATGEALEAGRIDLAKARAICDATEDLPAEATERIEAAALEKASTQTTGQLRRRIKCIARRLVPDAIEERKRDAIRERRLELWETPSGTADLALCDLAPEDAQAIYNKITAVAHGLRADGDTRPLNLIRADLATRLLRGIELPDAVRIRLAQTDDGPSTEAVPPQPGSNTDDALSALAAIVGRQLDHVRGRVHPEELPTAIGRTVQHLRDQLAETRDAACQGPAEQHGRPGHRPPAALRREIEARHPTCVFPTCNQPSHRCDLDHTVPWRPGITCRCNLAPLCRRHHRLKQSPGWSLHQIWPGLLVWVTPAGAWYIVRPDRQ